MSGRDPAFLDLTAQPAVGASLLSARPTLLYAGDGRRILFANAAGAAFLGEASMAGLLERRFSPALPSTDAIARFARTVPLGAARLERIRFPRVGGLANLAATCLRLALPGGEPGVLVTLAPPAGTPRPIADRARDLVERLADEDCLVAVLDEAGATLAEAGGFATLAAGEAAVEQLVGAMAARGETLVKRALRIGDARRPVGMARFESEGAGYYLMVLGPAERIEIEPPAEAIQPKPPVALAAPLPEPEPQTGTEARPEPALAQTAADEAPAEPAPPEAVETPAPPVLTLVETAEAAPAAEVVEATTEEAAEPAEVEPSSPDLAEAESSGSSQSESESETAPAEATVAPFRFAQPTGPTRFVFQMDGETRFTFVSPDLAGVVGPEAADLVGRRWAEVAAARGLDPKGTMASVLARRDTWSGVTLEWPVDGGGARVAVDLAALPAFSRDRRFEGYRGFGVIRPLEPSGLAEPKPSLAEPKPSLAEPKPAPAASEPAASEPAASEPAASEPAASEPAEPGPAPGSNVVRLPRAVPPAGEAERLSPPEQEAFRRIAAALTSEAATRSAARKAAGAQDEIPATEAEPRPAPPDEPQEFPTATAETGPEAAPTAPPTAAPNPAAPVLAAPDLAEPVSPQPVLPQPAEASVLDMAPPPPLPAEAREAGRPSSDGLDLLVAAEQKVIELEAILDTATDGILVVGEEGIVERINRSAEALFGIDAASVAGRPFTELLAEESRRSALDYLDGLARNGVASVLNDGREVIGRVPQGGLIPLFMTMGRLAGSGKFCAVLRDITQWKNAEEELINARRAAESASMQKSDFLAKVSHEIRTPLNAIIGFSEVMMEERFGPIGTERYKEYLRDIHVSGAHLMSLLNDLLDLSKIEAGKLDLAFQAVALNEIVMECVALLQPQANRERIIIRTSLSGQVPNIVADPRSIRQIVLNLVSNAIKFTLAGGQVIVSTVMEDQGEVTLRIRDTGVGMSASDIETALKPFRQLSTSRARRSDGTGLGLPLTKALVEANRAAFAIDSAVGQGTLIHITFPATRVLAE